MKWIIRVLMAATFGLGYVCLQRQQGDAGTLFVYYNLGLLLLWVSTFNKTQLTRSRSLLAIVLGVLLPVVGPAPPARGDLLDIGPTGLTRERMFDFSGLNGPAGGEHTVTFEFNKPIHVFSKVSPFFNFQMGFTTTFANDWITGTGFIVGQDGASLCVPRRLGAAYSDAGDLWTALFPLAADDGRPDMFTPLDVWGVQFNMNIPADTIILSGWFDFGTFAFRDEMPVFVGRVPDSGPATAALLGLGLLALLGLRYYRALP